MPKGVAWWGRGEGCKGSRVVVVVRWVAGVLAAAAGASRGGPHQERVTGMTKATGCGAESRQLSRRADCRVASTLTWAAALAVCVCVCVTRALGE
jgi:hypothetical protein